MSKKFVLAAALAVCAAFMPAADAAVLTSAAAAMDVKGAGAHSDQCIQLNVATDQLSCAVSASSATSAVTASSYADAAAGTMGVFIQTSGEDFDGGAGAGVVEGLTVASGGTFTFSLLFEGSWHIDDIPASELEMFDITATFFVEDADPFGEGTLGVTGSQVRRPNTFAPPLAGSISEITSFTLELAPGEYLLNASLIASIHAGTTGSLDFLNTASIFVETLDGAFTFDTAVFLSDPAFPGGGMPSEVPLPAAFPLMLAGLAGLGLVSAKQINLRGNAMRLLLIVIAAGVGLGSAPASAQFKGLVDRLGEAAKQELEERIQQEAPQIGCLTLSGSNLSASAEGMANCLEDELTAEIEDSFGRMLRGEDIELHKSAVMKAVASGQESKWKNEQRKTHGAAKVVREESISGKQTIAIAKSRVKEAPPLELIGEQYEATSSANVRSGPGVEHSVVGGFEQGSIVTVIGKVQDLDWYMIGEGGVATGFAYSKNFVRTDAPAAIRAAVAATDIDQATVEAKRTCRTVEQTVTNKKGKTKVETIKACQGANGWEIV